MAVLSGFYPDEWHDSTFAIDYRLMYKKGYRGVIYDIDNTLVPHGAPADERAIRHFARLKELGFQFCLISNNKEPRVASFAKGIGGAYYVFDAHKPSKKAYLDAVKKMGLSKEQVFFVGDQIFTDVYGAKRAGLYSILVKPIHPKEEIQIVLKRYLENIVLYFYKRECKKNG
ncbi:MAG: YqeG family HAD IIIA-type phosphatase [Lachnospiraceae bacterium]|nr:YqeG family HAD IIIA-type phosphatase [Lachnospiraceae bacterium]